MNINGYCPFCNVDLDGDLVINYPLKQGRSREEALEYAEHYAGWNEYGEDNRWSRAIGIYDVTQDRTMKYRCPDCDREWDR